MRLKAALFVSLMMTQALSGMLATHSISFAQDGGTKDRPSGQEEQPATDFPPVGSSNGAQQPAPRPQLPKSPFGDPPGAVRLAKDGKVWVDIKRHAVFVDGRVVLREGPPLEMFACPVGTKEHESIVAVNAEAKAVHAGLLAAGAKSGTPVQFKPYKPASGMKIDILVQWLDEKGRRHHAPAQQWVRHGKTKKQLAHPWVFAGSGFWVDEMTGEQVYKADAGDLICVSNFDTATLDLPIASTQANADLEYEAFTENIPPVGTPVRLVLLPRIHDMADVDKKGDASQP